VDVKRLTTADAATLALFFGTCALTAKVYSSLPAVMPTHFDLRGVANGWMPRQVGAWILPVVALATAVVVRLGALALPPAWKERLARSPTDVVALLLVAFMAALQCVLLYAAIAKPPSVGVWLNFVLAVFWIALGLVMPRIRRNPWIGVRTVWTVSSDENWAQTHRFAGYAFTIGGIVALLCTLTAATWLATTAIVVSALVPAVQSYRLARRSKQA
jgi:immunity protein, SdpI family